MADMNVSRLGQIDQSGDAWALFLKKFGGEVLTSYEDANITDGKVLERNIDSGKSGQFPAIGKIGAAYHTPGTQIMGRAVSHNEVIITVDGQLISDAFVANIDELMNHYEVRAPYSMEMGRELARQYDENNLRCIIQAARQPSIVQGHAGGTTLEHADMGTDGQKLSDSIWHAAQALDENNAPSQRWVGLRPAQYYLLASNTDLLNENWGGRGSYADAELPTVAGISVVRCNHIPNADDSGNTDLMEKYRADYSRTRGIAWTNRAAGVVKLASMMTEGKYMMEYQGTLMLAKYLVGHGALRPDNAVELALPSA